MVALSCYLSIDLKRDWCPFLYATDGAIVYGLGGSRAPCTPDLARALAAAAGDPSCVVYPLDAESTLMGSDGQCKYVLPFKNAAFKTQFSIKKDAVQHAIVFSSFAVCVRRLVMKSRWHGKKATVLVDSLALMFAV